jgi:endonuclease/exonuclease/phosphatase family metal-dependent hydrolase
VAQLKVATFNIEWMAGLFNGRWTDWDGTMPATFAGRTLGSIRLEKIEDVPALCKRIAGVIKAVKPHILCLQEGPPLKAQMERFVKDFLDDAYVVHTSNAKWQTLHALVRKSIADKVTAFAPSGAETLALRSAIRFYPWGAIDKPNTHKFDRTPLVLTFKPSDKKTLRLINVHTKSKYSLLKKPEQWLNRDAAAIKDALLARQKLSAEILRLREYILTDLSSEGKPNALVVLGDMNDGPYAELMEREFMIHNVVDELIGSILEPDHFLKHAMTPAMLKSASTVSFPDPLEGGAIVEELIDHLLVSPGIWQRGALFKLKAGSCKVEKQAYDAFNDDTGPGRKRGLRPSDHKPVSAVFEY